MQEVPREQLIPGKEYYLQNFETTYFPPKKPYKMIAKFKDLKKAQISSLRVSLISEKFKIGMTLFAFVMWS
jgi:hypothetical protein